MLNRYFLHPWALVAGLALLAILARWLVRGLALRIEARQHYGQEDQLLRFSPPISLKWEKFTIAGWLMVALLLVIVVAMPISSSNPMQVPRGSTEAVMVIDDSYSFAAEDHRDQFPPLNGTPPLAVLGPYGRRIDEVQMAIEEQIMPALVGNELGIVLFRGESKDQVELEDNFEKIKWEFAFNWMEPGQAPGDGSDYGKGLATALKLFANAEATNKQKVIVLFSDGGHENMDRKALEATVQKIKAQHIKVIVVAVGSEREMKVPDYNEKGVATGYVKLEGCEDRDAEGNCQTKLDLKELQGLASAFGTEPLLLNVGAKLPIRWATTMAGAKAISQPEHLFHFFAVPCLLLAIFLELVGSRSRT